jgi:hypothetical protein
LFTIAEGSLPPRVDVLTRRQFYIRPGESTHLYTHKRGKPVKKEDLPLCENDVTMRKLENTGLVYRVKKGWYRLTTSGTKALKDLNAGLVWYNEKYQDMMYSSTPPYRRKQKEDVVYGSLGELWR